MSDPPTPSRIPQHDSSPLIRDTRPAATASTTTSTHMPGLAITTTTFEPPFYESIPRQIEPDRQPAGHATLMQPAQSSLQPDPGQESTHGQETSQIATQSSGFRGGRKAKAHVASACINCKRAHLSCDIGRPCARCIASGKQDTCVDVQHKKRGRPRLREEGDFKPEQLQTVAGPSTAIPTPMATIDQQMRPIAATRQRRAESFRSLRSQGSEVSAAMASPTYPVPPPTMVVQPAYSYQARPAPDMSSRDYEVPTAYLDLDLIIIKANMPFRQIMLGGRELARRPLSDIATPADGESFETIRNRLRAEREAREPLYMPPIILPGHDPLHGALETDVDHHTRGFHDQIYTWTQTQVGPARQNFPARVRLAKASSYFMTVTLPSFRPVEPLPAPSLYTRRLDTYSAPRSALSPQSDFHSHPGAMLPAGQSMQQLPAPGLHQPSRSSAPIMQPSPRQGFATFQSAPATYRSTPTTPRLRIAEPPTETTAFIPRTAPRELLQPAPAGPSVQLPPILGSSTPGGRFSAAAGLSELRNVEPTSARRGELPEDEDREGDGQGSSRRSPRKRRRMDIDQVLH